MKITPHMVNITIYLVVLTSIKTTYLFVSKRIRKFASKKKIER